MIENITKQLPLILMIIPILLTYVTYKVIYLVYKKKWKAIHLSVQYTAIFYVIAVTIMINVLFQLNVASYMIIFHIALLSILLIIQWKTKTEVMLFDGLKLLFRLSFLIFFLSYIGFSIFMLVDLFYSKFVS